MGQSEEEKDVNGMKYVPKVAWLGAAERIRNFRDAKGNGECGGSVVLN